MLLFSAPTTNSAKVISDIAQFFNPMFSNFFLYQIYHEKNEFKQIFHQVAFLLAEEDVLSLKELFVDGTKIEANANKYTFVWDKSIKTHKEKRFQTIFIKNIG